MSDQSGVVYLAEIDEQSVAALVTRWRQQNPQGGVLVFLAEQSRDTLPVIQQALRKLDYPMVGGIFPRVIADARFQEHGAVLFLFQKMPEFYIVDKLDTYGNKLAAALAPMVDDIQVKVQRGGVSTAFLFFDGLVSQVGTILDTLYFQLSDDIHYAGVNAGSETFQPMPCLFDGERVEQQAMLLLLLELEHEIALAHGIKVPDEVISATSTQGNRIASIDWRPAYDVYQELAKSQYGVDVTKENFYQVGVHFPFGILRADGEVLVRIPVALEDDGALHCVGEVPANAILTLLRASDIDGLHTPMSITARLGEEKSATPVMLFYCAGRRMHLGELADKELKLFVGAVRPSPVFGALSLGEIGSAQTGGYPLFHNAALVALRWRGL